MNITRKFFTGLAAAASLIAIGALAPKAAKAVYSSPVSVVNTNTQPVPGVDVEKLARIPYESTATAANCPNPGVSGACFFTFAAVPTGYRLVVENLAGYFQISPGATADPVGYLENSAFRVKGAFTAPRGQLDLGGHTQAAFSYATRYYVDASENIFAVVSALWSNGNSEMILSGYVENCSITGCPAVQH
jgi:hypothetical protein